MKNIKKLILTVIFVVLHAFGAALAIKAAVGVTVFDAFNQTLAESFNLKIGSMIFIVNLSFVFLQMIISKKVIKSLYLFQFIIAYLLGYFVNIFLYEILLFRLDTYYIRIILFIISIVIVAFSIAAMINIGLVTYPGETLCVLISEKNNINFRKVRLSLDIILIVIALFVTYIFKTGLYIREGTILSTLLLSPLLSYFIEKPKVVMEK